MNFIEVCRKVVTDGLLVARPVGGGEFEVRDWTERDVRSEQDEAEGTDNRDHSWTFVDGFSAQHVIAVYDGINDENKSKYLAIANANPAKAVSIAFKLFAQTSKDN